MRSPAPIRPRKPEGAPSGAARLRRRRILVLSLLAVTAPAGCTGRVSDDPGPRDGAPRTDGAPPERDAGSPPPADAGPERDGGACVPTTCVSAGASCGSLADGCGGTLACGDCALPETCGGGGTANRCAAPVACGPAPAGATPEQAEALRLVNEVRMQVGVPCATMIPEINTASQGHADYGERNAGDGACRSSGHDQTMGCPGYTGARFDQRMAAAGYSGGRSEIVHFLGGPAAAIPGWLGTLWHRIPIVQPASDHFGYGNAPRWNVMDFGRTQAADRAGVWFYPPDGASIGRTGGDESPSPPAPPAGCSTWGTFVTVMFAQGASVSVATHELTGPAGAEVHEWVTPADSPFLFGSVYAMVPCPLTAGATYTIHVAGTLDGAPFDRSSRFTAR